MRKPQRIKRISSSKFTPLATAAGPVMIKALVPGRSVDNTKGLHGQVGQL
jgi:hypothetical protein